MTEELSGVPDRCPGAGESASASRCRFGGLLGSFIRGMWWVVLHNLRCGQRPPPARMAYVAANTGCNALRAVDRLTRQLSEFHNWVVLLR